MKERLLTLAEIQAREKVMLQVFHDFCIEHHLRYYLCGGTLLGAVRHGDFIPWDDDIDLLMPRPDYEKMQKIACNQPLLPKYKFLSPQLSCLNDAYTKMADMQTRIEKHYTKDKYDTHLWIDIFPMDGLPEDPKELETIYKESKRLNRILVYLKAKPGRGGNLAKKIVKPILKPLFHAVYGKKRTVQKLERLSTRYNFNECKSIGGISFGHGPQEKMPKEEYLAAIDLPFGDRKYKAPGCYDLYLSGLYGNYMTMPPKEEQIPHVIKTYVLENESKK